MKNMRVLFALLMVAGLSLSVFAWRERRLITATQEISIYSLANRYVEAICNDPSALIPLFQGSVIPSTLINKSSDFLAELNRVEGECFGQSKEELQDELLNAIRRLPEDLVRMNMATEFGVKDFLDCLVDIDNSFYSFADASTRALDCVEHHLDIRGFWYDIFVRQAREVIVYPDPITYPGPVVGPIEDPAVPPPVELEPIDYQCYDSCIAECGSADVPSDTP